jgi:hypothetical protein
MKIKITKKGKIALLVILGIIVLGTGGYLLWRVLQEDTVAPTDSDASGGAGSCCYIDQGCVSGWECRPIECTKDHQSISGCNSVTNEAVCVANNLCFWIDGKCTRTGTCVKVEGPPPEGDCKDVKCEWPTVVMSDNDCACEVCNGSNGCSGNPEKCDPPSCPEGYESCGVSGDHEAGSECNKVVSKMCWGNHPDCNNPFVVYRYCKPISLTQNICEGKTNLETPSGKYSYCQKNIAARVQASDPDDIDNIVVKLNTTTLEECGTNPTETCYQTNEVEGNTRIIVNINEYECLEPGDYTISMDWTDGLGNEGPECMYTSSFTIEETSIEASCGDGILGNISGEQCELGNPTGVSCTWDTCNQTTCLCPSTNPDWTISKVGVESCVVEGETTYGRATYTISITNVGDAQGDIDRVVDNLDTKVVADYLNSISGEGIYSNGQITWDLEGEDEIFSINENQTFTYYIQIPASAFGTYDNTVTAYPSEGDSFSADETVDIDCDIPEQPIPETAIFDTVLSRIIAGVLLMLIGFNWSKINYSVKEYLSDRRIQNFENKVAKKK